ncbi:hypothetical protein J3R30DRAFT_3552231 [Lentinula aciculospora]|uniref:Uncharacterized protein n=1 Tax=Lentinula aciculospora TaxID=153920 RepID=A0A9W8ZX05_9AGAR|nr:hypothetical protein J3R30DRAFT_3552231 [Lentinula aciculospora]
MRLSTLPAASIWSLVLCLFSLVCATPLPMYNRSVPQSSTSVKRTESLQARGLPYFKTPPEQALLFYGSGNQFRRQVHYNAYTTTKRYVESFTKLPTHPKFTLVNYHLGFSAYTVRSKVVQNFEPCCPSCEIHLPSDWKDETDNRARHILNNTKPDYLEFPGVKKADIEFVWPAKCLDPPASSST